MEVDLGYVFYAEWGEGAQADVEGDFLNLDAASFDSRKRLFGKVQTGRRRGDRASLLGEDGLIAGLVRDHVFALDVGRQRHVADPIQSAVEILDGFEAEGTLAEFTSRDDFGCEDPLA